jgi:hypothetical protein
MRERAVDWNQDGLVLSLNYIKSIMHDQKWSEKQKNSYIIRDSRHPNTNIQSDGVLFFFYIDKIFRLNLFHLK